MTVDDSAYEDTATRDFLSELSSRPHVRVMSYPSRPFNYALTVNEAVPETTSPFVLLLNDDTEVVYDDWLEAMVGYAQDDRVGAVGGQLVYPDGTIHSAGMLLGARAIAENRYHRRPELIMGYGNRAQLAAGSLGRGRDEHARAARRLRRGRRPRYLVPGGVQRRRLLPEAPPRRAGASCTCRTAFSCTRARHRSRRTSSGVKPATIAMRPGWPVAGGTRSATTRRTTRTSRSTRRIPSRLASPPARRVPVAAQPAARRRCRAADVA